MVSRNFAVAALAVGTFALTTRGALAGPKAVGGPTPNWLGGSTYTDSFCSYQAPGGNKSACVSTTGSWFHDGSTSTDWTSGPSCTASSYNGFSTQLQQHYYQYTVDANGNRDILFNCTYSQSLFGQTTCVDAAFVGDPNGNIVHYYNGTHNPPC